MEDILCVALTYTVTVKENNMTSPHNLLLNFIVTI